MVIRFSPELPKSNAVFCAIIGLIESLTSFPAAQISHLATRDSQPANTGWQAAKLNGWKAHNQLFSIQQANKLNWLNQAI
jgi:hypothetical protein